MKLSVWPTAQQSWQDMVDVAGFADESGWYAVYLWDHFMGDGGGFGPEDSPNLESTAALASIAALTTSVRIGPMVLGNTYRHPAVVANWAATVDQISEGRLILGMGAGWQANEHAQYGIELPPPGERRRRLDEACTVVRSLWSQERTTFNGSYYQLTDAFCEPKPVQSRLPLLIGAKGDLMLKVVARHADRWNMWSLPEQFAQRSAVLDAACEEIGRDPSQIKRSTQALVFLTDDAEQGRQLVDMVAPRAAVAGPPQAFADTMVQWRDLGVDEVLITDSNLGRGAQRLDALSSIQDAAADLLD
ncbi:MAG: LLM class flavin-dependent oxidoreductase [Microthrixaceae bacterium]|nr:LLM class flavin-dependent oxidoreductase [Microthrixaceae bacterium]